MISSPLACAVTAYYGSNVVDSYYPYGSASVVRRSSPDVSASVVRSGHRYAAPRGVPAFPRAIPSYI